MDNDINNCFECIDYPPLLKNFIHGLYKKIVKLIGLERKAHFFLTYEKKAPFMVHNDEIVWFLTLICDIFFTLLRKNRHIKCKKNQLKCTFLLNFLVKKGLLKSDVKNKELRNSIANMNQ
ncbi:hypothetical protein AOC36_02005 [Erysipelothrix larvae]|uniref:Uncharacterized protein n=1 Tax=Erysipelothrix larvae TaxID=1514105 RepID=A0A0X8GYK5_9FIRM|nr:hypothetical protein AOC36_02005 [Erysipelothrix larvae]